VAACSLQHFLRCGARDHEQVCDCMVVWAASALSNGDAVLTVGKAGNEDSFTGAASLGSGSWQAWRSAGGCRERWCSCSLVRQGRRGIRSRAQIYRGLRCMSPAVMPWQLRGRGWYLTEARWFTSSYSNDPGGIVSRLPRPPSQAWPFATPGAGQAALLIGPSAFGAFVQDSR
jgi:hypothetical protein